MMQCRYLSHQYGGSPSWVEYSGFVVTKPNGEVFKFHQSETGLHYLDTVEFNQIDDNEGKFLWWILLPRTGQTTPRMITREF